MKTTYIISILTLFFLFLGLGMHAQDATNLNPVDEFTYKQHTATISASEEPASSKSKTTSNTIDQSSSTKSSSSEAGQTPGLLAVSLTGAATYTIPIQVPPGISGVTPEIAISYNSQAGDGTAGYGWNISGLSTITRIPSTKYHDGVIDPVDFDNLDRFALDGQRLVLKSGTYGANGAVYQTENYSNIKITSLGTSVFGADFGPYYFLVRYPDGSIAKYGENGTSRSQLEYALTYWENPQGIRISYEYEKINNVLQIKKISYGSKGSAAPINEIRFVYENRNVQERTAVFNNQFSRGTLPKKIQVFGNGGAFKNYVLVYNSNSNTPAYSRKRLVAIQEYTGDMSTSLQNIRFEYESTDTGTDHLLTTANLGIVNIEQRNSEVVSLDLTGNGKMDFMVYPDTKDKFYLFKGENYQRPATINTGGKFENIFPTTWLNHQNKILGGQGFTVVQNASNNKVKFKVYSDDTTNPVLQQYEKTWNAPTYTNMFSCTFGSSVSRINQEYISGDFNGDGLTDVIAIGKPFSNRTCRTISPPPGQTCGGDQQIQGGTGEQVNTEETETQINRFGDCCECTTNDNQYSNVTLINLDRRITTGFSSNSGQIRPLGKDDRVFGVDVNGDGKTDIMHVRDGNIDAYTINENNLLEFLWTTTSSYIKNDFPILLGDYNGDGKTDFITPDANNSNRFHYFLSSGRKFILQTTVFDFTFKKSYWNATEGKWYGFNLIPVDINSDGKTDIVRYETETRNNSSNGIQRFAIHHNLGVLANNTHLTFKDADFNDRKTITGNLKHFPVPVFLSSQRPNHDLEFATISDQWIHSFQAKTSHKRMNTLRRITNNGVTYDINYSTVEDTGEGSTYRKGVEQVYPYAIINNAPGIKIVSSVKRKVQGSPDVQQTFYYKGAVSHLGGLGFRGFQYVSRSNWHTGAGDRIFTNTTHDILLRGAVIVEFQTPYTERFGNIPSDYISKITNTYEHTLASNKVFKIQNTRSTAENKLDGTVTTSHFTYDGYNNPANVTINYSGHGSTVTNYTYSNSTGSTYYIGRPTVKKVTSTVGSQSFSSEERYAYSESLVTSVQTKGNGTQFDTESYTYDGFGNITKIISTPYGETARTGEFTYDTSGRFLIKSKDLEGLITSYEYNASTTTLAKEINPYNQATLYEYDTWHRPIKVTDFLGNSSRISYTQTSNQYTASTTSDDGSAVESKLDPLQRMIHERRKTLDGNWSQITYEYDALDRVKGRSEPHFGNAPSQWNTMEYDFYGRVKRENLYTGKTISYTYNGLALSVNDGTKTVTTNRDAMGNTSRVDDPGGTIRYTYFGNGNMKTSSYEGATQTIEQDGWGRKTKLTDPSAGVYTYAYNGFSEITKETSPKGTTNYTYSNTGRILNSRIQGDLTDMTATYTYDSTTKLITRMDGNDAINRKTYQYAYYYDEHLRLKQLTENNGAASFSKTYEYDRYSRVQKEKHAADLNRRSSSSEVIYNYDTHGAFTGFDQWKIKKANARGQITRIELGTGDIQTMEYDTYGYLKKNAVYNADLGANYIENTYSFNAIRGTLASRTHKTTVSELSGIYSESFQYDAQDRLTSIGGSFAKTNVYDGSGRITKNSDIGDVTYQGGSKRYQLKNVSLNTKGKQFYQNRATQQISYNAFKKPVDIYEEGKGRVTFEYGPMGNRVRAWYGGLDNNKEERTYHKQYASIIPAEIVQNTEDNSYKFIFFKGGDAYSAPMAAIEKMTSQGNDAADYYLQRDHQGSILNITKEVTVGTQTKGELQERRQFGAWGTVDAFWSRDTGTTMGHDSLLDRGYTGHEHFEEVGLIHMNGRMYDPKMQRFLSPDNYIQNPYNTQNYNRYSYVLNNPLMYTDPTGEMSDCGCGSSISYANGQSFSDNINSIFETFKGLGDTLDSFGTNYRSIRDWVGGWFKKSSEAPKIIEVSNSSVSSDPLIHTSSVVPLTFTSSGGAHTYGNNIRNDSSDLRQVTVPTEQEWNNASMAWALGISGGLIADDATVIGVVDDVLIPVVLVAGAGAYVYDNAALIAKQLREINRILEKNLGGAGFTYELRATRSGQYPILARGSSVPIGYTHLNVGEVWKYGETSKGFGRYPAKYLTSMGLTMDPIFFGTIPEIKVQEKIMIYWYAITHGSLPPGNKIFR